MLLNINPHLHGTSIEEKQTHAGQAYFAGSGPWDGRCGRCQFWSNTAPGAQPREGQKNAGCLQYKRMMQGRDGPKVPADAHACKFFEVRAHKVVTA